jgi:ribose transport system ATP-binding protein
LGSSFFVNPGGDDTRARQLIKTLRIKCSSAAEPVSSLSGGNQQKVVLARWLATGVSVLVMDNPTRGVDAGAKEEIYQTLRELTAQGASILLISDDLLELIGLSNRIAVMRHGEITRVMDAPPHAKPSEVDLIDAMV